MSQQTPATVPPSSRWKKTVAGILVAGKWYLMVLGAAHVLGAIVRLVRALLQGGGQ